MYLGYAGAQIVPRFATNIYFNCVTGQVRDDFRAKSPLSVEQRRSPHLALIFSICCARLKRREASFHYQFVKYPLAERGQAAHHSRAANGRAGR